MPGETPRVPFHISTQIQEEFFEGGHFWVYELPEGTPITAYLDQDSRIRIVVQLRSDNRGAREFYADTAPSLFGFVARFLSRRLRRSALRAAVDDPTSITLQCIVVHNQNSGYPWTEVPAVVGLNILHPGSSLLPHEVNEVFSTLGIPMPPIVHKETPSRVLSPEVGDPSTSDWREGPVHGLYYSRKGGGQAAKRMRPIATDDEQIEEPGQYVSELEERNIIKRAQNSIANNNETLSVEAVATQTLDIALRHDFYRFTESRDLIDPIRSEISTRVARRLHN